MREIRFPSQRSELKEPPVITQNDIITSHGSEMSLFIYRGRMMYQWVCNLCRKRRKGEHYGTLR